MSLNSKIPSFVNKKNLLIKVEIFEIISSNLIYIQISRVTLPNKMEGNSTLFSSTRTF